MAQEAKQHESSQLRQTFSRISAMEQKFQSLKNLYVQNLQTLADKIKDAQKLTSSDQQPNPTAMPQTQQQIQNNQQVFDDAPTVKRKTKKLAKLIQKSKHFVAFTGSGICTFSQSADVGSERSNVSGAWTDKWTKNTFLKNEKRFDSETETNTSRSIPTTSHMALTGLMTQEPKYLKYVITETKDTFHQQSGISMDRLGELYSNTDNFSKRQHKMTTERAFEETEKADLFLVLGSSLTSDPGDNMAQSIGIKWSDELNNEMDREPTHHLVIVNTVKTELDHLCGLRIFATIDDVMTALMHELKLDVPQWNIQKFVRIKVDNTRNSSDLRKLTISGVDVNGNNMHILKNVSMRYNGRNIRKVGDRRLSMENLFAKRGRGIGRKSDVFVFCVSALSIIDNDLKYMYHDDDKTEDEEDTGLVMELMFNEQYKEPNLVIEINEYMSHLSTKNGCVVLKMLFDAVEREWIVGNKSEQLDDENVRKLWINYNDDEEKNKPLPNPYELHDNN